MNKLLIFVITGLLMVSSSILFAGEKWYSDGSLHRSSISQWKSASTVNQIATAADWALTRSSIKSKVQKSGTMDTLRPYAASLVECVNEAAKGQGSNNMSTSELAAACMIIMKW